MIVVADTNVVLRIIGKDDNAQQTQAALKIADEAERLVVPVMVLCEFCWVLRKEKSRQDIAAAIRCLLDLENIVVDTTAVRAGLHMLDAGDDFADGVIQHTGSQQAGAPSVFASFDHKAVRLLEEQGFSALVPTVDTTPKDGESA